MDIGAKSKNNVQLCTKTMTYLVLKKVVPFWIKNFTNASIFRCLESAITQQINLNGSMRIIFFKDNVCANSAPKTTYACKKHVSTLAEHSIRSISSYLIALIAERINFLSAHLLSKGLVFKINLIFELKFYLS